MPYCCRYFHLSQTKDRVFLYDKQLTRNKSPNDDRWLPYVNEELKDGFHMLMKKQNIWLFIGLSLFFSVMNFLKKATHRVRMSLWKYIISLLNRTVCCVRLSEMPCNTPHYRRLKADLDIQDMLFEYSTLVLSQAYFVLYHVESFGLSMSSFVFEALKKVAIGIEIDFFFNFLSNFVQIHYYNLPINRV